MAYGILSSLIGTRARAPAVEAWSLNHWTTREVLGAHALEWREWKYSVVSDSFWHGLYSLWNSPGQNTGVSAFPFFRGSSQARDPTQVSRIAGRFSTRWATREAQEYWSGSPIPSPMDLTNPGCRQILYQLSYQENPVLVLLSLLRGGNWDPRRPAWCHRISRAGVWPGAPNHWGALPEPPSSLSQGIRRLSLSPRLPRAHSGLAAAELGGHTLAGGALGRGPTERASLPRPLLPSASPSPALETPDKAALCGSFGLASPSGFQPLPPYGKRPGPPPLPRPSSINAGNGEEVGQRERAGLPPSPRWGLPPSSPKRTCSLFLVLSFSLGTPPLLPPAPPQPPSPSSQSSAEAWPQVAVCVCVYVCFRYIDNSTSFSTFNNCEA